MMYLIEGRPDSGKSERAEALVLSISGEMQRYYLATMIPYGEEGKRRIEKHKSLREGKNFHTIECPYDIDQLSFPVDATVLVECVSNLVANELFERKCKPQDLTEKIIGQLVRLNEKVHHLVIVTNHFPLEDENYDDDTRLYAKLMEEVNCALHNLPGMLV